MLITLFLQYYHILKWCTFEKYAIDNGFQWFIIRYLDSIYKIYQNMIEIYNQYD